jgi:hypothetical protein
VWPVRFKIVDCISSLLILFFRSLLLQIISYTLSSPSQHSCRQFTPKLVKWYQSQGANKVAEVVFLSADHNEKGFKQYYNSMPWLAVEYDDDAREQLMSKISVSGIPRLVVLDGRTGRIVEDNAVGKELDLARWRKLAGGDGK